MRIFKLLLLLLTIFGGIRLQAADNQIPKLPQTLVGLMDKIQAHPAFSYKFSQENFNLTTGQTIRAKGTVVYKSPDKFRWDYTSSPRNILASNGKTLFMILPEDRQALIQSAESTPELWSPLEIFARPKQLQEKFQVETADSPIKSLTAYRLLPRTPENLFDYLILAFNPESSSGDFTLTIFDLAGNRNMLDFMNYSAVKETPDFTPNVPNGYETLDFSGHPVSYTNPIADKKGGNQP